MKVHLRRLLGHEVTLQDHIGPHVYEIQLERDNDSISITWYNYNTRNAEKGSRRRSIRYCPHLWKSPLQPFQPTQQSHCFAGNDELVAVEDSIDMGNVLHIIYDSLFSTADVYMYSTYLTNWLYILTDKIALSEQNPKCQFLLICLLIKVFNSNHCNWNPKLSSMSR